jgi:hypothetical protein
VCLHRAPEARYASALQFAQAIEAGLRGELTEATRQLALADTDATRALPVDQTSATRALRSRPVPIPPREPLTPAPSRAPARVRDDRPDRRKAARRRQLGTFLALLAILAAIGVVGAILLSSTQNDVKPVDQGDVQSQIDGVRDFIREHSQ